VELAHQARGTPEVSRILFIGHSGQRSGAPLVLQSFLEWMKQNTSMDLQILLKTGGPLVSGYQEIAPTFVMEMRHFPVIRRFLRQLGAGRRIRQLWRRQRLSRAETGNPSLVYVNSVASLDVLRRLNLSESVPVLTHVHELEDVIRLNASEEDLKLMRSRTTHYLTVSEAAKANLVSNHSVPPKMITIARPFLRGSFDPPLKARAARAELRRHLSLPEDALVVGGCGGISSVKGTDLFVSLARVLADRFQRDRLRFLWIGGYRREERQFFDEVRQRVRREKLDDIVHFTGEVPSASSLFGAFDVFCLPSRSDAMATVAIEAGACGVPVVCFNGAGGIPEFVGSECGMCAPYLDVEAMAAALARLLQDATLREELGRAAHARACSCYGIDVVAPQILQSIRQSIGVIGD
jgi:glycosyltransferase involved in cell wall biosynthesis